LPWRSRRRPSWRSRSSTFSSCGALSEHRAGRQSRIRPPTGHGAEAIRASTDKGALETVTAAAREANDLIDRRTFSWTEFFNLIETTLPPDVMLTAVRPDFREGAVNLSMTVVGRSTADLDRISGRPVLR
jgi:hypothetical protein